MQKSKSARLSNIELLRIVAMMLVLFVHANYYAFGAPSLGDLSSSPISVLSRTYIQGISVCCVNIFVLISGWFGIHVSKKGFSSFVFQCLYFLLGVYAISVIVGGTQFTFRGLLENFLFVNDLDYWFIKSYIGLYLLSPVLNVFCEKADKRQFQLVLITFFTFQTLYGWLYPAVETINGGYSIFSFMGLYMLARYARLSPGKYFQYSKRKDLLIIVGLSFFQLMLATTAILSGKPLVGRIVDFGGYINPVTILMSLYAVVLFSKLKITSKTINNIAKSSFAVYLFHTHKCIFKQILIPTIVQYSADYPSIQRGGYYCYF